MSVRITCISKDGGNHENPYTAISELGWTEDGTGKRDRSTRLQMYDFVQGGGVAYVLSGNDKAYLTTAVTALGTKYVKTKPDDTKRDNLLSLPEC